MGICEKQARVQIQNLIRFDIVFSKPLCYTLSKVVEISNAMVLAVCVSLRASPILYVMVDNISTVNHVDRNPYCLSHKRWFLSRCSMTFLLIKASKVSLMILRRLIRQYQEEEDQLPAFLRARHTLQTFHMLGTGFFIKQRLNNIASIRDKSRMIILRTTPRILCGPVAFLFFLVGS